MKTAPVTRIAVLASCFNRKAVTLRGLESLFRQRLPARVQVTVFLVDDASTDGTAAAVEERFPAVRLLRGDGSLWWVGAMRMAFGAAMAEGFDGYVWWNDDTQLTDDALLRLLGCAEEIAAGQGPAIIVGSTCDPETGARTYGGWVERRRWYRFALVPVDPDDQRPTAVDTMNGNLVLISAAVAKVCGNMESSFRHRLADHDYGLRAKKAGFPIIVAPGYLGTCRQNSSQGTWKDGALSVGRRWQDLMSPRGMNPREWFLYTRRHYGWLWPLYLVSPYVKTLAGVDMRERTH